MRLSPPPHFPHFCLSSHRILLLKILTEQIHDLSCAQCPCFINLQMCVTHPAQQKSHILSLQGFHQVHFQEISFLTIQKNIAEIKGTRHNNLIYLIPPHHKRFSALPDKSLICKQLYIEVKKAQSSAIRFWYLNSPKCPPPLICKHSTINLFLIEIHEIWRSQRRYMRALLHKKTK